MNTNTDMPPLVLPAVEPSAQVPVDWRLALVYLAIAVTGAVALLLS